ncbi:MAG: cation-transporting P-type ATPase [Gammaproteobacteria bacterium]
MPRSPSNVGGDWHAASPESVLAILQSAPEGLAEDEVQARLQRHGHNRLPEAPRPGPVVRFLAQFDNILIYVLLACAGVTALLQHWIDTVVILAVVIANALIGFVQEGKAESAMDAIRRILAPQASVYRNGRRRSIAADELVPGDVVFVEAGDKVPADLRLLQAHGLSAQEAILTGESVPVGKRSDAVAGTPPLGDRTSMLFAGTLVTAGQGRGVIVATGADTELGRISGMLAQVEELTTPLVQQMQGFARWLTFVILGLSAVLLGYGYFVGGQDFAELFMAVVSLAVSAIPEGLPAVLSITLALGAQAMARRNAIVRRLPAIETIGSVSVICTDKTGTLTRNEMMVVSVLAARRVYDVEGTGYEPAGAVRLDTTQVGPGDYAVLDELARAFALCNDATLEHRDMAWTVSGDPMEGALLACACKLGSGVGDTRRAWTRTDAIPFDARHAYMATLNHDHEHRALILVKGAPERVLAMCSHQLSAAGSNEPVDNAHWQQEIDAVAAQGQRVLAFAQRAVDPAQTVLEHSDLAGLTLLGMVGMIDPPRAEATQAVAECRAAGIRVKMITGDHAKTAIAIGRQIGLVNADSALTGNDLDALDDAALMDAIDDCDVFARTSPTHKLRIVTALQAQGRIVAMTGDGVNDAPALKRADIGIAMGQKGSEAAREASELVLADDNFASIVAAVHEGRTVYNNIRKVIGWMLPTNSGEALIISVALLLGFALPIIPIQILWINLVTECTLGLALAFEPADATTMRQPPRPRNAALLSRALVWHIVLVSLLFLAGTYGVYSYALDRGYPLDLARTMALNTLVVLEIFHLFFIRNIDHDSLGWSALKATPAMWISTGILVVAQLAVTYAPPLQAVFQTAPLAPVDVLLVLGIGIALFIVIEVEKQLRRRLASRRATTQEHRA